MFKYLFAFASILVTGLPADARGPADRFHAYTQRFWYADPDEGRRACLEDARNQLLDFLRRQQPPITRTPSVEWIDRNMVRGSVPGEPKFVSEADGHLYPIQLEVELTPDQLRRLRADQRMIEFGRAFVGVLGAVALGLLFFRLDHWTRGYLTWPLAVGSGVAIVGGLAAWFTWVA